VKRYLVRVWIDDIEVEADSPEGACEKACMLVDDGDINIRADYAEVQKEIRPPP